MLCCCVCVYVVWAQLVCMSARSNTPAFSVLVYCITHTWIQLCEDGNRVLCGQLSMFCMYHGRCITCLCYNTLFAPIEYLNRCQTQIFVQHTPLNFERGRIELFIASLNDVLILTNTYCNIHTNLLESTHVTYNISSLCFVTTLNALNSKMKHESMYKTKMRCVKPIRKSQSNNMMLRCTQITPIRTFTAPHNAISQTLMCDHTYMVLYSKCSTCCAATERWCQQGGVVKGTGWG